MTHEREDSENYTQTQEDKGWEIPRTAFYMMPVFGQLLHMYDIANNAYESSKRNKKLEREARDQERTNPDSSADSYQPQETQADSYQPQETQEEPYDKHCEDENQEREEATNNLERKIDPFKTVTDKREREEYSQNLGNIYTDVQNGAEIYGVGTDEYGIPHIITEEHQLERKEFYESSKLSPGEIEVLGQKIQNSQITAKEFFDTYNQVEERNGKKVYELREGIHRLQKTAEDLVSRGNLSQNMAQAIRGSLQGKHKKIRKAKAATLEETLQAAIPSFDGSDVQWYGQRGVSVYENIYLNNSEFSELGIQENGLPVLVEAGREEQQNLGYVVNLSEEEKQEIREKIHNGELTTKDLIRQLHISDQVDAQGITFVEKGLGMIYGILDEQDPERFAKMLQSYEGLSGKAKRVDDPLEKLAIDQEKFSDVYTRLLRKSRKKLRGERYQSYAQYLKQRLDSTNNADDDTGDLEEGDPQGPRNSPQSPNQNGPQNEPQQPNSQRSQPETYHTPNAESFGSRSENVKSQTPPRARTKSLEEEFENPLFMREEDQKEYGKALFDTYRKVKGGEEIYEVGTNYLGFPFFLIKPEERSEIKGYRVENNINSKEITSRILDESMDIAQLYKQLYSEFGKVKGRKGKRIYDLQRKISAIDKSEKRQRKALRKNTETTGEFYKLYTEGVAKSQEKLRQQRKRAEGDIVNLRTGNLSLKIKDEYEDTWDDVRNIYLDNMLQSNDLIQSDKRELVNITKGEFGLPEFVLSEKKASESQYYSSKVIPENLRLLQRDIRAGKLSSTDIFEQGNMIEKENKISKLTRELERLEILLKNPQSTKYTNYQGKHDESQRDVNPRQKIMHDRREIKRLLRQFT
jgi:hypothetical protein